MGSVHALTPKPPRKDLAKLFSQDGKVLRFTAQYANPGVTPELATVLEQRFCLSEGIGGVWTAPPPTLTSEPAKAWRGYVFDPGGAGRQGGR